MFCALSGVKKTQPENGSVAIECNNPVSSTMFTLHRTVRRAVGFGTRRLQSTQPNVASPRHRIILAAQGATGIGAMVGSVGGVAAAWRETHAKRNSQSDIVGVPDIVFVAPFYCTAGAAFGAAWVIFSPILVPTSLYLYMKQQRERAITQHRP